MHRVGRPHGGGIGCVILSIWLISAYRIFHPKVKKHFCGASGHCKNKKSNIYLFIFAWSPFIINLIVGTVYMGIYGFLIFFGATSCSLLSLLLLELHQRKKDAAALRAETEAAARAP